MASLSLRDVTRDFGRTRVLDDVSLDVEDGELVVLVGPSGCGKSTLLRIVAGLVSPTAGEIRIDGKRVNELDPSQRDVAMVFQSYALYPHMSVRKNLGFPLKIAKLDRKKIEGKVAEAAELLGLTELLDRKPGTLSGGQMQRVALGRAIVRSPRIFLFDEPLSNLDAKLRTEMRTEIARLHEQLGITTIYVTHDQAEAMTLGERICVLSEGRVQQVGPPLEVFARPRTAFVATFLGSPPMNLVRGRIEAGRFRAGTLSVPAPSTDVDGELVMGVRPHEIEGGEEQEVEVTYVERFGTHTEIHCAAGERSLVVTEKPDVEVEVGERVGVNLPPEKLHWFLPDGVRLM